jgi:hypothetical protein
MEFGFMATHMANFKLHCTTEGDKGSRTARSIKVGKKILEGLKPTFLRLKSKLRKGDDWWRFTNSLWMAGGPLKPLGVPIKGRDQ